MKFNEELNNEMLGGKPIEEGAGKVDMEIEITIP
jgi:hypothetical protein